MNRHKRNVLAAAFVVALPLALSASPCLAEDPYMAGLKAESGKLESLGREARKEQEMLERQSSSKPAAVEKKTTTAAAPSAKPALGLSEFETGLKQYPAGFGLYEKLDSNGKQAVFAEYSRGENGNRRYAAAIKKTIELSVPARK